MAVMTPESVDEYATEAATRTAITQQADGLAFDVESYGITDKDTQRTVSLTLVGNADNRPTLHKALALAFAQHGYTLDSIKVTAKAIKDTSQIALPL
jgi:hypothetical protein